MECGLIVKPLAGDKEPEQQLIMKYQRVLKRKDISKEINWKDLEELN